MRTPYDARELDALADRYFRVKRVRFNGSRKRITFEQFLVNPDAYEALTTQRLRSWNTPVEVIDGSNLKLNIN